MLPREMACVLANKMQKQDNKKKKQGKPHRSGRFAVPSMFYTECAKKERPITKHPSASRPSLTPLTCPLHLHRSQPDSTEQTQAVRSELKLPGTGYPKKKEEVEEANGSSLVIVILMLLILSILIDPRLLPRKGGTRPATTRSFPP